MPNFVAVYVPSDTKWSFELESIRKEVPTSFTVAERVQRCLVALSVTSATMQAIADFKLGEEQERAFCIDLVKALNLGSTHPRLSFLIAAVEALATQVRAALSTRDVYTIDAVLAALPVSVRASLADALLFVVRLLRPLPKGARRRRQWALCFDELEMAPQWLQTELLRDLRSTDQRLLLKLTWTPIVPDFLRLHAQPGADYDVVRLWNSHVPDFRPFCRMFAERLIKDRLGEEAKSPELLFGRSSFARDEAPKEEEDAYARGTEVWDAFRTQASSDRHFATYLKRHGVNPQDPSSAPPEIRDRVLRKVKPIVLLRDAFRKSSGGRSRKKRSLYSGEDAIYAMSDGNPRWLAGLLNDLLDALLKDLQSRGRKKFSLPMRASLQADVLEAASRRMVAFIRAFPVLQGERYETTAGVLVDIVDTLGKRLEVELLGRDFNSDPIGGFLVDDSLPNLVRREIERGLLIGALILLSEARSGMPDNLRGARVRLSFMLAPVYKLTFRNFRAVGLSGLLGSAAHGQRRFPVR
ncbi:MAG TPA: hypothetical protein VNJ70_05355 [Thermoanaerobaculia bacterium]|nr:hypothetical protein [Thermoanaerobaculia bacterium]